MGSLATDANTVDQYMLNCVRESQLQLSLLMDLVVALHTVQPTLLSEEELSELYNPASVYTEVLYVLMKH